MSAYGPNNGWTCSECGHLNEPHSYNCDSDECEPSLSITDPEEFRWRRVSSRWEPRDKFVAYSDSGMLLYRVRRWVSGRITFTVLVPGGYSYRVEWYRVPSSVRWQATAYFRNEGADR